MRLFSDHQRRAPIEWLRFAAFTVAAALILVPGASASERATLEANVQDGYGRLVLTFPDRLDLPAYALKSENGVLVIAFDDPVAVSVPDVAGQMPEFFGATRADPDGRGIRFGLKSEFRINRLEAGERLFVDLLPAGWQGLEPGLPIEVVAELARRAQDAGVLAARVRKAELVKLKAPAAEVRVGRHPTFIRLQFTWNVDTEAVYSVEASAGTIGFSWPVAIDLYPLINDLPAEVLDASNTVSEDGSDVTLRLADGIEPRFYEISRREFVVDIDLKGGEVRAADPEALLAAAGVTASQGAVTESAAATPGTVVEAVKSGQAELTPQIKTIGSTIRVDFPFEQETAAAVFRRAGAMWLLFDTQVVIKAPKDLSALEGIAAGFGVVPAGATQIVRIDLDTERLATLGSEGRSWVLSLGDVLLTATEPVALARQNDGADIFSVTVDLERPAKVHQVRDPIVGDMLSVVTAYPPARGMVRQFDYVDFSALRSVHGLVVKAWNDGLEVAIVEKQAVISAPGGLTVSAPSKARALDSEEEAVTREGYIDLAPFIETEARALSERREQIMQRAADSEGRLRDTARLELARFFLANQLSYEALGVLGVLSEELMADDLADRIQLTWAAASVLAGRPADALSVLNLKRLSEEADALMWRTIAKSGAGDFAGARLDALAAEPVIASYPVWTQILFYLSGARAAVEAGDGELAQRLLDGLSIAALTPEEMSLYKLLSGRIDALGGRFDEALDTYGQVITADIRPTRTEAIYETLALLDNMGQLDVEKAAQTLSVEVMVWRGNPLEAKMQTLLADLDFRSGAYRDAFETVRQAVAVHDDSAPILALAEKAGEVFANLFLDGAADAMAPVDALSLYYDFRHLTPPGARGDEMIRNLARRLVKVDLLQQAADLLEYQIDNRLKGAARAQIAADLAVIDIANRAPEAALRVLNRTSLAKLPPELERQRRVIEARALIDAGRDELALDLLGRLEGRDVDLLRVDAHWRGKRYRDAAELLELIHAPVHPDDLPSRAARSDLVKAAVGFVLANDPIGLSRLRSKFSGLLDQTPEWPMFDFVTDKVVVSSREFRKVAREIANMDSVSAFLASYRAAYGAEGALTPVAASRPNERA